MWFMTFDLPVSRTGKATFQMRWGWLHPVWLILLVMFIIPHDTSTRLDPNRVGSAGFQLSPRTGTRLQPSASTARAPAARPRLARALESLSLSFACVAGRL